MRARSRRRALCFLLALAAGASWRWSRSEDGGRTWRRAGGGLPPSVGAAPYTPVRELTVHPHDPRIVYLGSEAHGIYKTTDGGETWRAVNEGLPGRSAYPTSPSLLAISTGES